MALSIQNRLPLSGEQVAGPKDSRRAAHMMLQALVQNALGDKSRVFVAGFSAGKLPDAPNLQVLFSTMGLP